MALEVPCILVHWNVDDAVENGEDAVLRFHALFKLDVLVPERVSKEVEADALCTALK